MSELTPQQLAERLRDGSLQLVDVREPSEYEAGRIGGSRLVPLGELSGASATIDQDAPVVFVCRSGARSAMATDAFAGAGYDAHNLTGGLQAWAAAGLPLEPEHGHVA